MTKTQMEKRIAKKAQLTEEEAHRALESVIEITVHELEKGRTLTIPGFGTFMTYIRPETVQQDAVTGVSIQRPAAVRPCFKAAKNLIKRINEKYLNNTQQAGENMLE